MKKTLIAFLLLLSLLFTSCEIPGLNLTEPPVTPGTQTGPVGDINDAPISEELSSSQSSSALGKNKKHITVVKGTPTDLSALLDDSFDKDGVVWESACDTIATVSDGTVTGVKCGRTEICATAKDGNTQKITVTVEFLTSSNNGFTFPTLEDNNTYTAYSVRSADRLVDEAIAAHKSQIIIDFSGIGHGYNAARDYNGTLELSNHVSITKHWYENAPNVITFKLDYEENTASDFTEQTTENTHFSLANANMVIRQSADGFVPRPDDFEDFPINLENSGTMDVYNSEELWWALEHNLKPTFPLEFSKAELFYERAKMLLRDIISEGMTDYQKVLAIYDALVDTVAYDYDAAAAPDTENFHTDVCYYLEGVFERGLAVCDGKSKAFVLLCGIEGIGAVRDFGDSRTGGAGHAWNYVELDGYWYLVDTTDADASYSEYTGFGSFFEKQIEVTRYDLFLAPMDSLKYEYTYSGIWTGLSAGDDDTLPFLYLTENLMGSNTDFYIDDKSELKTLIAYAINAGECDEYVLTFAINPAAYYNNLPFEAADTLLNEEDYDIFTIESYGITLYFMLIKNA